MFFWIIKITSRPVLSASLVITMALAGCENRSNPLRPQYSLDSLLNRQVHYLLRHHASINKVTSMAAKESRIMLTPSDTVAWKKELDIFHVIDAINKPINRDVYKIEIKRDVRSNLDIRSFSTDKDLPVSYVNIYYKNSPERIRKIEASYRESNPLYSSVRNLSMVFEPVRDTVVLTSYSITGGQKMMLDDTVRYDIKGYLILAK